MIAHALYYVTAAMFLAAVAEAMTEPLQFVKAAPCKPDAETCEFWLHVRSALTMVHQKKMTIPSKGQVFHYDVLNISAATPVDLEDVVTADGYQESRLLYLVNGTLPGPTIQVYPGQKVVVHVFNHLHGTAVSIHWHGLHQKGTPFSDGVGFVSQCPILPDQKFTYRFEITQPSGTYWYHGHVGSQRTMGMYGAFIIKNKPSSTPEPEEHVLQIQDYNHDWDSDMSYYKMVFGMYKDLTKIGSPDSLEGGHFSLFNFQSGLINGRGRYYDPKKPPHNEAPLSTFPVEQGRSYRLRFISAGSLYPFRVSVDHHELQVVATDGYDVQPMVVESFIINPGERFDVMIEANQPVANYWIRIKTLQDGVNNTAEAILNYKGVNPQHEPGTSRRPCTVDMPCKVLNCPFQYYPHGHNTTCIPVDMLRSKGMDVPKAHGSSYKQFFLNFAFPGNPGFTPGSVNGRAFFQPQVSAVTQMDEVDWDSCNNPKCGEEKVCACTNHVDISYGDTVQMVFLNMGNGKGWSHPVHLHGHSFYVLKMGWARYNNITGKIEGDNLDIDCRGHSDRAKSFCNNAGWANPSWMGDNIPGINLKNPPLKDTVIVPTGSYVVVRFKADNPGIWFMHCHIEIHNLDGMAVMIREAPDRIPPPPEKFPTCRSFDWDKSHQTTTPTMKTTTKQSNMGKPKPKPTDKGMPEPEPTINYRDGFWACIGVIIGVVACALVSGMWWYCCCRRNEKKDQGNQLSRNKQQAYASTATIMTNDMVSEKF